MRTLSNLFSQSFSADRYEVVVVVDGSTDGTSTLLRGLKPRCGLRVVEQTNRGLAAARNAGVRAACGDLVIFIDDDIICGADLISAHLSGHQDADDCVALGPTLVAQDSPASLVNQQEGPWRQEWLARLDEQRLPRWPVDFWVGHNTSLARAVFLANGGYDESFRKFEEYELGFRLRKRGVRFAWQPCAKTYHVNTKSVGQVLHEDAGPFGRCELILCRKHPEYRVHARLARLAEGSIGKRILRQVGARMPVSPQPLLRVLIGTAERLDTIPRVRDVGRRLLGMSVAAIAYRGALAEAGSWEALRREFGMRLPVLVYHHIGPPVDANPYPGLTMPPQRFERQIRWLAERGYAGISPSDWLAWRNEGTPLPSKPILITFDDGYADTAEYAFPILRRYGFHAVVHVVTGHLGGTNAWDENHGYGTLKLMTEDLLRHWADNGIEFGAHSRSHSDLTTLNPEKLNAEVAGSGEDLQRIIGVRPVSFAYPYGIHNEAVRLFVSSVFDLALTCDSGLNDLATDPHLLRRSEVASTDSWIEFVWRVRLGGVPVRGLRRRLHSPALATATARKLLTLMWPRTSP